MANFILEIGTEEIPARFFPELTDFLAASFREELMTSRLAFGEVKTFSTPRRMIVWIEDLAATQEVEEKEILGPPANIAFTEDGEPKPAALGFARSQDVDFNEVYRTTTSRGEYLAVRKKLGGARAEDVLGQMCENILSRLPFPKKMQWEESRFHFGRPLRWLLALLDERIIPVELAGLRSGRESYGHRVMAKSPFSVQNANEYFAVMRDTGHVVVDENKRRQYISEKGDELARGKGGRVVWNDGLLDQVTNLVEFPVPLLGRFDDKFLELPKEVLLTSMETHQKSFGLEDDRGKLLPFFLTVINLEVEDEELIRKGWQRVLRARLEDARFFWEADKKTPFADWQQRLEQVIFLAPLGSMGDKSRRLSRLGSLLARKLAPELEEDLKRAGLLAKADLVSGMVGEFDDLQGIMGGIYARLQGENENVSSALYEQYLPAGQSSPVPESTAGALLALADKIDTLAGCFGLNMIPTGTADPYALRRQVLGVCRIILEHGFRLDLEEIFRLAFEGYENVTWKKSCDQTLAALQEFTAQRLKAFFGGQGFETRIVDAALGADTKDVLALRQRLEALADFSRDPDFDQAVLTFKRVDNIIRKQNALQLDGRFDQSLLTEDAEKQLADKIISTTARWEESWEKSEFDQLFKMLFELRPTVDAFFDSIMVMCEDETIRKNRLNLLYALVRRLGRLADFSALQV